MRHLSIRRAISALLLTGLTLGTPALASDRVGFDVAGGNETLAKSLKAASLIIAAEQEERTNARDLMSAALADYARLLDVLYANGHFSGAISIRLNGREATDIPLLDVPSNITRIEVRVDPGPAFAFGSARVAPLAGGTVLPEGFAHGEVARSSVIREAVSVAVDGWRDVGHAKATVATQSLVADHAARKLSADVTLAPGPKVSFGKLNQTTPSAVRAERIQRMAGLPSGQTFSPGELDRVAQRLRRSGAFSSVSLTEAETLGPGDTMDIGLALADEKPRRFGFGAELSSLEGLGASAFWMHRNLFGGAERLRLDAEIKNIGAQSGGIDYSVGARLDIPALFGPDSTAFLQAGAEHLDEPGYITDRGEIGGGAVWYLSEALEAETAVFYTYSETKDGFGRRTFSTVSLPATLTWDKRTDALDASRGFYLRGEATPFVGVSGAASGLRAFGDGRLYREVGSVVLAARLQVGALTSHGNGDVDPGFLFYSGGGGTVRGQPYQSLGTTINGVETGGRSFVGTSLEARIPIGNKLGAVAFWDAGYVGGEDFYDGSGKWHAGAGLGVRYKTGIGPIRLDIAAPVGGDTGKGVQFYIGIGQAF